MTPLPIDAHIAAIAALVGERRAAVVTAPPGSGKTTRIPPALLSRGPLVLLQPRRIAARALARRIAAERGWTVGEEVGWQVRFERRFTPATRLLVATEGVLTARLQQDPLLHGFATVVLDEFHERSLHGDLALALAREAQKARPDLAIVVLSATIDALPVAAYLGGAPVVDVPGRPFPVDVRYAPGVEPADAVLDLLARPGGHVLVFLAGAPEIRRVAARLAGRTGDALVLPLHGSLDADEQDRALVPSSRRKVILATNLAETSLTVDGVTDVVDAGEHKVLRHDLAKGIDRLETERIPADSAAQRAGRAGRTGPGTALRLWDPRDTLRRFREPEIQRVDLAAPFLDVLAWGGDPLTLEWLEPPPRERAAAAMALLASLGLAAGGRITPLGDEVRRFPLHPRLARVLAAAGGSPRAAAAVAVLSERDFGHLVVGETPTADSDVLVRIDRLREAPPGVRRAAEELAAMARRVLGGERDGAAAARDDDEALLRALLAGYPDRVARRRAPGSPRLLLASGTGAVLARESGVRNAEWLVALDLAAGARGPGSEALVRLASRIERDWLTADAREVVHRFDAEAAAVRAVERETYGALVLAERPVAPDAERASELLVAAVRARGLGEDGERVIRRLRFAGLEGAGAADVEALVRRACAGKTALPRIDLAALLPAAVRTSLERLAPASLRVPSGREHALEYREDGSVHASVKLQELFGLAETPRVGPRQEPVTLALLAPSGRPVQTTRDLRSFWERTYPEVRKELRGRYPKHPWPEDPWSAQPTHRTKVAPPTHRTSAPPPTKHARPRRRSGSGS